MRIQVSFTPFRGPGVRSRRLGSLTTDIGDMRDDTCKIVENLLVCEPHHKQPKRIQDGGTFVIVVDLVLMNCAIDLDDNPGRMAVEVDDEPLDDLLTAETKACQPLRTELLPEDAFRLRHLMA